MSLLEVSDVAKSFGGVQALDGVTFQVAPGRILAIMGPNGAGKTTLLDLISGRLVPDRGSIRMDGRNIVGSSLEANGRRGLVRTFQEARLPNLTVLDYLLLGRSFGLFERVLPNLSCFRRSSRHDAESRIAATHYLRKCGFDSRTHLKCSELSLGDQKMLHQLRALWRNPRLLLLDEPTCGLSAPQVSRLIELMREFVRKGNALVMVSHDRASVASIADEVLHLSFGKGRVFDASAFGGWAAEELDGVWRRERFRPTVTSSPAKDTATREPALAVDRLAISRGSAYVIQEVTFAVHPGEVVGIIGPNGAGKSSTVKAILGVVSGRSGKVFFQGRRIDHLQSYEVARAGVGVLLQGARIPPRLTVEAALQMAWQARERYSPSPSQLRKAIWEDLPGLDDLWARFPLLAKRMRIQAGLLSGGEQTLLSLAMTMARRPLVLLLDEPSTGLQDQVLRHLLEWLANLAARGLGLVVVEQDVEALQTIANRCLVMDRGRLTRC